MKSEALAFPSSQEAAPSPITPNAPLTSRAFVICFRQTCAKRKGNIWHDIAPEPLPTDKRRADNVKVRHIAKYTVRLISEIVTPGFHSVTGTITPTSNRQDCGSCLATVRGQKGCINSSRSMSRSSNAYM